MNKSFSVKTADEAGLARLSNEIRLLWKSIPEPYIDSVVNSKVESSITRSDYANVSQSTLISNLDSRLISHGI